MTPLQSARAWAVTWFVLAVLFAGFAPEWVRWPLGGIAVVLIGITWLCVRFNWAHDSKPVDPYHL
ncbi:MAG TPA: hypothetical protein VKV73_14240 [Chloroflexota bacterium]|nr:hypothetical protein [Chloroflexota bacterium]